MKSTPPIAPSPTRPQAPTDLSFLPDSFSATAFQEVVDRSFSTALSKLTGGLSPAALLQARNDWFLHLLASPGKQMAMTQKAWRKWARLLHFMTCQASGGKQTEPCIEPLPQDKRFVAPAWQQLPFSLYYQSFLLQQQWWHNAMTGVSGVSEHHERVLAYTARQLLDIFSPSNFLWSNPEVLERTAAEGGQNLYRGMRNFIDDLSAPFRGAPEDKGAFQVGRDVACTPGKIVYRNHLIELIQYEPTTNTVRPEPILIVPAWINKYYILDLSPENSLVRYLTAQGFTVFMISWLNPGPADRDLGMNDYQQLGVNESLTAVLKQCGEVKVHGVGYCLGGTLLAIAAATLCRDQQSPFASLSFFASQFDFTEPGELQLFIDESQLNFLENMMWEQGFLDARQMSGAFQLLNSNDLIWSRNMHAYLMGEKARMFDLMAWNADSTRMPYRMHAEYLRKLYLNNDLAEGRYQVGMQPIALTDIDVPVFSVATEKDHVAPWHSVYKAHLLLDTELTFALTNGGHNAGIVSEPGHANRHYRIATQAHDAKYISPQKWQETAVEHDGSWWLGWTDWLCEHSGQPVPARQIGAATGQSEVLDDAPGQYVLIR
ncbi:MAG: PHA/PHB synthase family protein [Burkholderiaceae bacterium]